MKVHYRKLLASHPVKGGEQIGRFRKSVSYGVEFLEGRVCLDAKILAFTTLPAVVNAGASIGGSAGVEVEIDNAAGQPIPGNTDVIQVALGANSNGATLSGTLTSIANDGVAIFSSLSISQPHNGYSLIATDVTDPSTTPAISGAFNVDAVPIAITSLHSLSLGSGGVEPVSTLVADSSGNLYGTTLDGGAFNDGTIYELSGPGHSVYSTLYSFDPGGGSAGTGAEISGYQLVDPIGGLAVDPSGNLYGTLYGAGSHLLGSVYELSADHSTFSTLVNFTGQSGAFPGSGPNASLTLDSAGDLFGTTSAGGSSNDGTIFELAADHKTFTSLISFTGAAGTAHPGSDPLARMVMDGNGNLFGTTYGGGDAVQYNGTVFELAADHKTFRSLITFAGAYGSGANSGSEPDGGLVIDGAGNIYGTTESGQFGDGEIFEYSPSAATASELATFGSLQYSGNPIGDLLLDSNGNLFGTSFQGGGASGTYDNKGFVFELSANHATLSDLINFTGTGGAAPGSAPCAGLYFDPAGNLYGTTSSGGTFGAGTAFELSGPAHSTLTTLASFSSSGGDYPFGPFVMDSAGDIFGTTYKGGAYNDGTIFEMSGPNLSVYTTLVSLSGTAGPDPGQLPFGLVMDPGGNLFGETYWGGTANAGTVFELSHDHSTFTTLYSFTTSLGGYGPQGSLVLDSSGDLFGTTSGGGSANDGTLFELSANDTNFGTLVSFTGDSGAFLGNTPGGNLVIDASGNIYGTTDGGGAAEDGTLYEYSPGDGAFTSLISFTGNAGNDPGTHPQGLVIDSAGTIDGVTMGNGQSSSIETIFQLAPDHVTFSNLLSVNGASPYAGLYCLSEDSSGNLYGTAEYGGRNGNGLIFELSSDHTTLTALADFTGTGGSEPGAAPESPLILESNGNLLGATAGGGTYGAGTVFEITPGGVGNVVSTSGTVTIAAPSGEDLLSGEFFSSINAGAGAMVAATPVTPGPALIVTNTVSLAGSTSAWTGTLDLTNDDLDVTGGSLSTITSQLMQGYANGTWTGTGITSSAAANDTTHLTALGVVQNNGSGPALFSQTNPFDGTVPGQRDILVKYTFSGDANLDGKVDGSDYSLIDAGYASHGTLTGWYHGDFNYDGVIDGSDYALIDNAFNNQSEITIHASSVASVADVAAQVAVPVFSTGAGAAKKPSSAARPATGGTGRGPSQPPSPRPVPSATQIATLGETGNEGNYGDQRRKLLQLIGLDSPTTG